MGPLPDGDDLLPVVTCRACGGPATASSPLYVAVTKKNAGWLAASRHVRLSQRHPVRGSRDWQPALVARIDDRNLAIDAQCADDPEWSLRIRSQPRTAPSRRGAGRHPFKTVTCRRCGKSEKRVVEGDEGFFDVEYRGRTLRAATLDRALLLLAFIEGTDRRRLPNDPERAWARRIPTHFLTAKARATIAHRLKRRIEEAMA